MKLEDLLTNNELKKSLWLSSNEFGWHGFEREERDKQTCRRTLGLFFKELTSNDRGKSCLLRHLFNEEMPFLPTKSLPTILAQDSFIRMYAEGKGLQIGVARRIFKRFRTEQVTAYDDPLFVDATLNSGEYHDVNATPPGILAKLFSYFRIKGDPKLLEKIQSDLIKVSLIKDNKKRQLLTFAILAHGASYRELEGKILQIPSLSGRAGEMVPYSFRQHLIWEGVKTVSAFPLVHEERERGIYLCQGTEIWPSQPSVLGSIFANFCKEGTATEPYAHSWRRIHKHLRYLTRPLLPYVVGHSMGGSLAIQIALYSHPLIEKAFAFNPPLPEKRDYDLFQTLSQEAQGKLKIFASIDDLPFWRIGSYLIGDVTCFLGEKRWTYYPLKRWEAFTLVPALGKMFLNMMHALPAHQKIVPLLPSYIFFSLTEKEKQMENAERSCRFDHLNFFPKFYGPTKVLLGLVRKIMGWQLYDEYIKCQIEIIELQEAELQELYSQKGDEEIKKELEVLALKKEALKKKSG